MSALVKLGALATAIASGDGLAISRAAADLLLDFVPVDELKGHLDAAAVERADALTNAAEAAKFGG